MFGCTFQIDHVNEGETTIDGKRQGFIRVHMTPKATAGMYGQGSSIQLDVTDPAIISQVMRCRESGSNAMQVSFSPIPLVGQADSLLGDNGGVIDNKADEPVAHHPV